MQEIEKILKSFNEVELAFFAKYRMQTYMPTTQELIHEELKKRDLTPSLIDQLVEKVEFNTEIPANKTQCPRCFSDKSFMKEDIVTPNSSYRYGLIYTDNYTTDFDKTQVKICIVCGFDFSNDSKPSKMFGRIKSFFSKKNN